MLLHLIRQVVAINKMHAEEVQAQKERHLLQLQQARQEFQQSLAAERALREVRLLG